MADDLPDALEARLAGLRSGPAPALPGAEAARLRGTARSRRRRGVLAGTGVALTVAAVAAGAALAPGGSAPPVTDELAVPSTRPSAPTEDPVRAALLDPEDVEDALGGRWRERAREDLPFPVLPTSCPDGNAFATTPPQQGDTGTALRYLDGPGDAVVGHAVLSFGSETNAEAAESRLFEALRSCSPGGSFLGDTPGRNSVPGPQPLVVLREGSTLSAVRYGLPDDSVLRPLADAASTELRLAGLEPLLIIPLGPSATAAAQPGADPPVPTGQPSEDLDVQEALLDPDDAAQVEPGPWTTPDAPQRRLLDPCEGGTAYPQDAAVEEVARRLLQVRREAGGTSVDQEVWRYTDAAAADEAVAGYERAVRGCPREPSEDAEGITTVYEVVSGPDHPGLLVRVTGECASCVPYPSYLAAVTAGNAVTLLEVAVGEDGDPGLELVQSYADAALAELDRTRG